MSARKTLKTKGEKGVAKNLSHIDKKLDRITHKLSLLDEMKNEQREMRLQTRYLAQMASTSMQLLQQGGGDAIGCRGDAIGYRGDGA